MTVDATVAHFIVFSHVCFTLYFIDYTTDYSALIRIKCFFVSVFVQLHSISVIFYRKYVKMIVQFSMFLLIRLNIFKKFSFRISS